MFKWIRHLRKTKKQNSQESRGRDFSTKEKGLDEEQMVKFTNNQEMNAETPAENEVKPTIAIEEKREESTQSQDKVTVAESMETLTEELLERRFPQERPGIEETEPDLPRQDSQTINYSDEVELAIDAPVDLKMVSKLYEILQTIPDLRILYTSGSVNRGTIITIVLERPMPLTSVISSKIPEIEAIPELHRNSHSVQGKWNSLLGNGKKGIRRITLTLKKGNTSNHE